tara:strand:+ start:115 stop:267 length:153 start_codon:yes stop_codon:yes gene_type:complete
MSNPFASLEELNTSQKVSVDWQTIFVANADRFWRFFYQGIAKPCPMKLRV